MTMKTNSNAAMLLSDEEALSDEQLAGVAGGFISAQKPTENADPNAAHYDNALAAAPDFNHTGSTQANADASNHDGTVKAGAGASVGTTVQEQMGDVIVTSKYTVGAQAQAFAGPTGAGAGATVGAGVSTHFDLGRGVEVEIKTEATAKAGVAVGISGRNLVGQAGAEAGFTTGVEQKYTSDTFGDGARFSEKAHAEACIKAEAGAEASVGANGAKMAYGAEAGASYKAGVECELGNETAAAKVEGGIISPGSVAAAMSGGVGYSEGKLSLNFAGELACGLVGAQFGINLDVQLFDNTHTVGTPEEIAQVEAVFSQWAGDKDAMLTQQWRDDLAADVHTADTALNGANKSLSEIQKQVDGYNADIAKEAEALNHSLMEAKSMRAHAQAMPESAQRTQLMETATKAEGDALKGIHDWQARMDDPKEVAHRTEMANKLDEAKNRVQIFHDISDAMHERLNVANSTSFLTAMTVAENTMQLADSRLTEFQSKNANAHRDHDDAIQKLDQTESREARHLAELQAELAHIRADAQAQPGVNFADKLSSTTQAIAEIQANLTHMAEQRAAADQKLLKSDAELAAVQLQYDSVKAQMTRLHPMWGSEADSTFAANTLAEVKSSAQGAMTGASRHEQALMANSMDAAQLFVRMVSDNDKALHGRQQVVDSVLDGLQQEHARLSEVVTDKGVLSAIGSLFS